MKRQVLFQAHIGPAQMRVDAEISASGGDVLISASLGGFMRKTGRVTPEDARAIARALWDTATNADIEAINAQHHGDLVDGA